MLLWLFATGPLRPLLLQICPPPVALEERSHVNCARWQFLMCTMCLLKQELRCAYLYMTIFTATLARRKKRFDMFRYSHSTTISVTWYEQLQLWQQICMRKIHTLYRMVPSTPPLRTEDNREPCLTLPSLHGLTHLPMPSDIASLTVPCA